MQPCHHRAMWHLYLFPPPYDQNNLLDIEVSHIADPSDSVKIHIWIIFHFKVMRIQHDLLNESNQSKQSPCGPQRNHP